MAKKIVVAEDEKPMARALELKLTKAGYEVALAFDGEMALAELEKGGVDFMLLDLVMPKMDGFQVLEEMNKRNLKVAVAVTSNLSQEEDEIKAKKLGAVDFFVKSNTSISDIVSFVQTKVK